MVVNDLLSIIATVSVVLGVLRTAWQIVAKRQAERRLVAQLLRERSILRQLEAIETLLAAGADIDPRALQEARGTLEALAQQMKPRFRDQLMEGLEQPSARSSANYVTKLVDAASKAETHAEGAA